ncbi:MAG: hypothetical protein WBX25_08930 [Rhodomicrobium sp.]
MFRIAAIFISVAGFVTPALAQDKEPQLPENTIDCKQFKKVGPQRWEEVGTAVFNLGSIQDINLTNQPVTPRYFKFGGFDLFPVLEQKCGADAEKDKAAEQGPVTLGLGLPAPKTELASEASSTSAPPATQASSSEALPTPVHKIPNSGSESPSCDGKPVYVADVRTADGEQASIEVAVSNGSNNSEFTILGSKNNKTSLVYRGRIAKGRFIFLSNQSKLEQHSLRSLFMAVRSTQHTISIAAKYIKPNRDGIGSTILYLGGLNTLLASKGRGHRVRFEGNPPSEALPEAFYFDRCE